MPHEPLWFTAILLGEQMPGALLARQSELAPGLQDQRGKGILETKGTAPHCYN